MADEDNKRDLAWEEARHMVKELAPDEAPVFSLDEIMSEYRYAATLSSRTRQPEPEQPVSQDTKTFQTLAREMKAFIHEQEKQTPIVEPKIKKGRGFLNRIGEMDVLPKSVKQQAPPVDFGPPETFGRAFAPSDDFVRGQEDAPKDEPRTAATPRPRPTSFLDSLRRRKRARTPAAPPIPVGKAAVRLKPYIRFLTIRLLSALVICLFMVFLTYSHWLADQLGFSLPSAFVFYEKRLVFMSLLMISQIFVMACGIDVMARGLSDLCRFRPGFESLALLSCVANILYVASSFLRPSIEVYLPYCAASALSVLCAMWSQRIRLKACRCVYDTAAHIEKPYVISREESLWPGGALIKSQGEPSNFVALTEQPDGAERFSHFIAPLEIIAALLLALVASIGRQEPQRFFWSLSAILSVAAPFCGTFCYTMPFYKISKRLARSGTALAGWAGAQAFFTPGALLIADRDLFPPGTVTLNGLKVFDSFSFDRMISYAASLTSASESCLSHAFAELLHNQKDAIRPVSDFRHYEGGGLGGEIGRDSVLLGNSSFMLRMGIRLPPSIKLENILFVAVNLDLVGVFAIHYNVSNAVHSGLATLLRSGITPLLATRDINLTPSFLGRVFHLNLSVAEYPTIEQRLELSDPKHLKHTSVSVVTRRETLFPRVEAIVGGRRLGQVARINLALYLLCTLAGLFIMSFLAFQGEMALASPRNVIAYLALWALSTFFVSGWVHRY